MPAEPAMTDPPDVVALFNEALAEPIAADDLEVTSSADGTEIEIIAEAWTFHLEGWPGQPVAWLALDDEPDTAAERRAALEAAIPGDVLAMLASVDRTLGGAIVAALGATGDPLSAELAMLLGGD